MVFSLLIFRSSHFSFLVFGHFWRRSYENTKILCNLCLHFARQDGQNKVIKICNELGTKLVISAQVLKNGNLENQTYFSKQLIHMYIGTTKIFVVYELFLTQFLKMMVDWGLPMCARWCCTGAVSPTFRSIRNKSKQNFVKKPTN